MRAPVSATMSRMPRIKRRRINDPCRNCKETVRFGACLQAPPLVPHRPRVEPADAREGGDTRRGRGRRRPRGRIAAADKDAARANLAAAGARGTLAVRINGVGTPWWREDLAAVRRHQPAVVVVPKAESADEVAAVVELLPAGVGLEVQIETARGLVEVERIAAPGGPLEALVFGPGDFAASIGVPTLTIGAASSDTRSPVSSSPPGRSGSSPSTAPTRSSTTKTA